MNRPFYDRRLTLSLVLVFSIVITGSGLNCPSGNDTADGTGPFDRPVATGNRPPRIMITGVASPSGDNNAEQGDAITISFSGQDNEDAAVARIFASLSANPTSADEIPILQNFIIGPGTGNGSTVWNTTGVTPGSYFIFGEIDDQTFDPFAGVGNPPVRTIAVNQVGLAPRGSRPLGNPPNLVFLTPTVNLGLSADTTVVIRYIYTDTDSTATITLLLDRDLDPTNDDPQNPRGGPTNPDVIILPSDARIATDPTFGLDDPPPNPMNPLRDVNSLEIRTNPRILGQTPVPLTPPFPNAPIPGTLVEYRFVIDFNKIPPRSQPVFLRADITDGTNAVHRYANGSIAISRSASGDNGKKDNHGNDILDCSDIGFELAGVRFQGFGKFESLGTDFLNATDIDNDLQGDFMIASRYATVRSRLQTGAAYLIFGRPNNPFPVDTDNNGIPDSGDLNGDGQPDRTFPTPPTFVEDPYDPSNVGRLGGTVSIEDVGLTFRGAVYAMPTARPFVDPMGLPVDNTPVPQTDLIDIRRPPTDQFTAGLTSIARFDLNQDNTPDFVFGLPFISNAYDYMDDDPSDGACDIGAYAFNGALPDPSPNDDRCTGGTNDDDLGRTLIDQGLVIGVDGTSNLNDLANFVDAGMAGQFDPVNTKPTNDEGLILGNMDIPMGTRFRGAWFSSAQLLDPATDPVLTPTFSSTSEFGRTVATITQSDGSQDLLVSVPGEPGDFGAVIVWKADNFLDATFYNQPVLSLPGVRIPDDADMGCEPTPDPPPMTPSRKCRRDRVPPPQSTGISGSQAGDQLGFADSAGNFNGQGENDIVAGAPGADRNGLTGNGVFYVLLARVAGSFGATIDEIIVQGNIIQIAGTHNDDHFGMVQTSIGDNIRGISLNGDTVPDVAFAAEAFDFDLDGDGTDEVDVGYIGVIFGLPPRLGEFGPMDVGDSTKLPGVRFVGAAAGAHAGHDVSSAGDYNGDGSMDMLITSPGEKRTVDGVQHVGVAYLIFGGTHLLNQSFKLSQVGQPDANGVVKLPGIVFVGRVLQPGPTAGDELAPLETVGGIGDIDGDGFDDIVLGAPTADFVNTASPDQRITDAGEVYLIYGNNFGTNDPSKFPTAP